MSNKQLTLTPRAQSCIDGTLRLANYLNHKVGPEHLLVTLLKLKQGTSQNILAELACPSTRLIEAIETNFLNKHQTKVSNKTITNKVLINKLIQLAQTEALLQNCSQISTEHLLCCIFAKSTPLTKFISTEFNINYDTIKTTFDKHTNKKLNKPISQNDVNSNNNTEALEEITKNSVKKYANSKLSILNQYGKNLTELARSNLLDPIIGRDKELQKTIQVLCRRIKNNPILLGEAGVGKTAIAEGIATKIANEDVPKFLLNKELFALDLNSLVAGTTYRGQFEERIKTVINEITKNKNIILFIDEIHMMVGAGSASGTMDFSNIIKPLLSRGELQVIGATTFAEFKKRIEKDSALERRFQQILISPPTTQDSITILNGIRHLYEEYHNVVYTKEAIEAAVLLTDRFMPDRHLPDKAIDVLDEAGSIASIEDQNSYINDIKTLKAELNKLNNQKNKSVQMFDFEEAVRYRTQERQLTAKRDILIKQAKTQSKKNIKHTIQKEEIAKVISEWTNIPILSITAAEAENLLNLEQTLSKKIIGQTKAIECISSALRRARSSLRDPSQPIGSFLFLGSTGVGKTFLAKTIADLMFPVKPNLLHLDMSEYMEKISSSKLLGSPPGYIGYEEGGKLTEWTKRHPYSVVLFDEIEKAHPDILNLLLQICDEGKLTDELGREVNFKNTIVILTSNIGAREATTQTALGFGVRTEPGTDHNQLYEKYIKAAKEVLKPELLNRLTNVIVFNPLNKEHMKQIIALEFEKIKNRALQNQNILLILEDSALEFLFQGNIEIFSGARQIKRLLENQIEDPLSKLLITQSVKESQMQIFIRQKNKKLVFEYK